MNKIKIMVGVCTVVLLVLLVKLSLANADYQDLNIQPVARSLSSDVQDQVSQESITYQTSDETVVVGENNSS